jgi:Domain of unknown function (DUF4386)
MPTYRKTAIVVGVLFIIATVVNLLSTSITRSIVNDSDYLRSMSANETQVLVGAFLALISAFASASIAIALYPILKKYHEGLALGSVGFRLIECMFYIIDTIGLLLLLTLSQAFVNAGTSDASFFQTIGSLLQAVRERSGFVFGVSAFGLGALMYYAVMYQARLVPRWLSVWGLVGAVGSLSAATYILFGGKSLSPPVIVLNLPIFFQEMVLAIWLIVKGFKVSAITSEQA